MDLKTVDMLTKKIAQDLGTGFLDTSDEDDEEDDDYDEYDDADDAEFRAQLMQEFKKLQSPAETRAEETPVPKQRMKQLYLSLLQQGSSIMRDKSVADQFLSKLDAMELTSLMSVLQMDPQTTIQYFNNDPEVIEAIQSTPSVAPTTASSLWRDLTEDDLLQDDDSDDDEGSKDRTSARKLRSRASTAVKEALRVFESNLVLYSQQPQQLLALCDKLPTEKDQQIFLDILFQEYTPEKMEQRIKAEKYAMESEMKRRQEQTKIDTDLVAHVFKEVFTHFRVYKRRPERFDALINRLGDSDSLEQQMFESLVKAFWDLEIEKVKL